MHSSLKNYRNIVTLICSVVVLTFKKTTCQIITVLIGITP